MKAEINNKNKVRFFSQYWGQEVAMFRSDNYNDFDLTVGYQLPIDKILCLRLKPLFQISNEDSIELGYEQCNDPDNANFGCSPSFCFLDDIGYDAVPFRHEADLLRSKGYALPWMGLSVDEMVQAGWIKLTEQ